MASVIGSGSIPVCVSSTGSRLRTRRGRHRPPRRAKPAGGTRAGEGDTRSPRVPATGLEPATPVLHRGRAVGPDFGLEPGVFPSHANPSGPHGARARRANRHQISTKSTPIDTNRRASAAPPQLSTSAAIGREEGAISTRSPSLAERPTSSSSGWCCAAWPRSPWRRPRWCSPGTAGSRRYKQPSAS